MKDSIKTNAIIAFENNISFSKGLREAPNKKQPNTIPVANAANAIGVIQNPNKIIFATVIKNISTISMFKIRIELMTFRFSI